jgi:hypothetical protein
MRGPRTVTRLISGTSGVEGDTSSSPGRRAGLRPGRRVDRGRLSDWIVLENGRIANYQVLTPTGLGHRGGLGRCHRPTQTGHIG